MSKWLKGIPNGFASKLVITGAHYFLEQLKYLEENFSANEVTKFADVTHRRLDLIRPNPKFGRKLGKRQHVYRTVINKRIILYYQYKPLKKEILLMAFWNTLQDPKRMKL